MKKLNQEIFFTVEPLLAEIRNQTNLSNCLDVILSKSISFFKATSGFIVILDDEFKVSKFFSSNLELKIDTAKFGKHPLDIFPYYCSILNKKETEILYANIHKEINEDKNFYNAFFKGEISSVIAVPILRPENFIFGSISIISSSINLFKESDLLILKYISEISSAIIDKLIKINQLNRIKEVSDLLFTNFSFENLVETLARIFDAYGCSIFLRKDKDEKKLYCLKASTGIEGFSDSDFDKIYYSEDEQQLTSYVLRTRKALRIYDTKDSREISTKAPNLKRISPKFQAKYPSFKNVPFSFLACPLVCDNEIYGVIWLAKYEVANYFTSEDEISLNLISQFIAARIRLDKQYAEIEYRNELEFLNNQIQFFAHDASHSFTTLNGYLSSLFDYLDKSALSDPGKLSLINEIKRLRKLTKLLITKIANSSKLKSKLVIKTHVLKILVSDLVSMLQNSLKKEKVDINISIKADVQIDADKDKLDLVLFNLILNSFKAISSLNRRGSITISADRFLKNNISYIRIDIEDDGPGVPEEIRNKIFNRGFSHYGGSGLGLTIAKNIIAAHNGDIEYSTPKRGYGSLFSITLPQVSLRRSSI